MPKHVVEGKLHNSKSEKWKVFDSKNYSAQLTGHFFTRWKWNQMPLIAIVLECRGKVLKINEEEPFLKRCKLEYEEGFSIKSIRGDRHCTANCFATHFKEPLDRVLDRLDSEFRENITFYKDFSEFNEDEILREVYAYITERRYNNSTVDMFLNAFAWIYNAKVVIHNSGIDVANTTIGCNLENAIHIFKNADHFDLMELPEKNVTSQNSEDQGYTDVGENVTFISGG